MNIANRLKLLRKNTLNLTQAKFGAQIGFKATAIGQMESGDRNVTDRAILLICQKFNVNEEWLRTGIGNMFKPTNDDKIQKFAQDFKFNNFMDNNKIESLLLQILKNQENMQADITEIKNKIDSVYEQTVNLTEFRRN